MNAVQRPSGPALALFLGLALALCMALASAAYAADETGAARGTAGAILDSLTRAPQGQGKNAQGFPKTPAKSSVAQSGPTAPAQPTAPQTPEVKALPMGPASPNALTAPPQEAPQRARPGKAVEPRPREAVVTLEHDGRQRLALVRMPRLKAQKKGSGTPRMPLVIFLHGAGGSARQAMRQTGLGELAERAGFIAVFPEGLAGPAGQEEGGLQTWNAWMCCGYARDQRIDDLGYLAALIGRLKADLPVDPRRIHLAGFSNGAMLASRFALERPGVLASIASVAGYLPCDAQPPQEPLPVLVIHGNQDHVARFGPTAAHPRTGRYCEDFPAQAQVEFWVRGLGLKPKPQQVQDDKKSRVRVERYSPGSKGGRALVEFVIVKGGGHAWPGGARERYRYCDTPTPDPDATALLWDFFKRQARPAASEKTVTPERPQKSGKKTATLKGKTKG